MKKRIVIVIAIIMCLDGLGNLFAQRRSGGARGARVRTRRAAAPARRAAASSYKPHGYGSVRQSTLRSTPARVQPRPAVRQRPPVTTRPAVAPVARDPQRRREFRSDLLDALPDDTNRVTWRRSDYAGVCYRRYYLGDWWWYEPVYYGGEVYYEEVDAPEGAYVETLPEEAEPFSADGDEYYTHNDVVYRKDGEEYAVVTDIAPPRPADLKTSRSVKLLESMYAHFRTLDRLALDATELRGEGFEDGRLPEGKVTRRMFVAKPDKVRSQVVGPDLTRQFWYDGRSATVFDAGKNVYSTLTEVPATIPEMVDMLMDEYGMSFPLSDIFFPDALDMIVDDLQKAEYKGIEKVNDVSCHRVYFTQSVIDWQVWIQAEGDPLFRQVAIQYKLDPGRPVFAVKIQKWGRNAETKPEDFIFKPPVDAEQIRMLPL